MESINRDVDVEAVKGKRIVLPAQVAYSKQWDDVTKQSRGRLGCTRTIPSLWESDKKFYHHKSSKREKEKSTREGKNILINSKILRQGNYWNLWPELVIMEDTDCKKSLQVVWITYAGSEVIVFGVILQDMLLSIVFQMR